MDESLFIRELGIKSPLLKVLDFLMDNEFFDYSKTDIAEGSGLSRTTLFKVWPRLEALELITAPSGPWARPRCTGLTSRTQLQEAHGAG